MQVCEGIFVCVVHVCVQVWAYGNTHIHIQVCVQVYPCMCGGEDYAHKYVCVRVCYIINVFLSVYTGMYICAGEHISMHTFVCMCIYMVSVDIGVYKSIYMLFVHINEHCIYV